MELDEMKEAWSRYDQKLTESLRLNEELLRKLNLDKSKREMGTPLAYEMVTAVLNCVGLLYLISTTVQYSWDIKYWAPGIITCVMMGVMTYFSIDRLRLMSAIDYYSEPVVVLQKKIGRLKQKFLLYRKIEFAIFPIFAIVAMPILCMALRHVDIYLYPWLYLSAFGMSVGMGYPLMIWIYKFCYEKKLKNANNFLAELNRFESEE